MAGQPWLCRRSFTSPAACAPAQKGDRHPEARLTSKTEIISASCASGFPRQYFFPDTGCNRITAPISSEQFKTASGDRRITEVCRRNIADMPHKSSRLPQNFQHVTHIW